MQRRVNNADRWIVNLRSRIQRYGILLAKTKLECPRVRTLRIRIITLTMGIIKYIVKYAYDNFGKGIIERLLRHIYVLSVP